MAESLIRVFLGFSGLFLAIEGACNLIYWRDRTRRLFQLGRALRMILGLIIIAVAFLGGA